MEQVTYVIDDDEDVRQSLVMVLRAESIRARSFSSAIEFLSQLQQSHRGCIVTDIRMPAMDGIALVKRLRELRCPMPVIVITGHGDVALAVEAMKAGAKDFIEKPFEGSVIAAAVRRSLELSRNLDAKRSQSAAITQRFKALTERESDVYIRISRGLSNKEVGLELNISPRTVEIHRANVMVKMNAETLSDLVRMSIITSQEDCDPICSSDAL